MRITDLRRALEEIREHAANGDLDEVRRAADDALQQIDGDELLTTTEAALVLGMRSVNTLKLLVRRLGIPHVMRGNRMMIPLAEVERLQDYAEVGGIRASDRAHDAIADLGGDEGLTAEELAELERGRPGRPPWKAKDTPQAPDAAPEQLSAGEA